MRRLIPPIALVVAVLSCSPEPSGVLDTLATPPVLVSVTPASLTVNSDTINVGPTRLPTDRLEIRFPMWATVVAPVGSSPVAEVSGWVTDDRGVDVSGPFQLNDRGISPDTTAGDGIYGGYVSFGIVRVEIGTWSARVAATGVNQTRSSIAISPVQVLRNNQPPVLSGLIADGTISSSDPNPLMQLRVRAVDPDGPTDIQRVYFNSYLPNGNPASGNPFLLFDDGNATGVSGDQVARDSVYSLRVQFGGAPAGTYRFEFRAIDRSSDSSNVIIHQVVVTP